MIRVGILGVAIFGLFTIAYDAESSGGLRLASQALDPGVEIESFAWLNSLTSISGFPGAPGLILRVPCFKQDLKKRAALLRTYPYLQIHTPDSQSWCRPQRIPRGVDAGRYVDQDGHVFARQAPLPGDEAPPPEHAAQTQIGAGGVEQIFDPPVEVKDSEWMTSLTTFSSFPGAPGLILRVPCFAQEIGKQPSPPLLVLRPPLQMPKFSSVWCKAGRIPRGDWAGRYVEADGEVVVPPP